MLCAVFFDVRIIRSARGEVPQGIWARFIPRDNEASNSREKRRIRKRARSIERLKPRVADKIRFSLIAFSLDEDITGKYDK